MADLRRRVQRRAFHRSRHLRKRVVDLIFATSDGFWLGALDEDVLWSLDEAFFNGADTGIAGYADRDWVQHGLLDWEAAAVERFFPAGGRILVTGAGGGREVVALVEAGYDAAGYEPNEALVRDGNRLLAELGHGARLRPMPRGEFPATSGEAEGVVVGWGSYMHIVGSTARLRFLRGAAAAVGAGAPILVSAWLRHPQFAAHDRRVARVGTLVRRLRGRPPVEVGDVLTTFYAHRFDRAELEAELDAAGFDVVAFAEQPYAHVVGRRRP